MPLRHLLQKQRNTSPSSRRKRTSLPSTQAERRSRKKTLTWQQSPTNQLFFLLRAIRPETGEEPERFFDFMRKICCRFSVFQIGTQNFPFVLRIAFRFLLIDSASPSAMPNALKTASH